MKYSRKKNASEGELILVWGFQGITENWEK